MRSLVARERWPERQHDSRRRGNGAHAAKKEKLGEIWPECLAVTRKTDLPPAEAHPDQRPEDHRGAAEIGEAAPIFDGELALDLRAGKTRRPAQRIDQPRNECCERRLLLQAFPGASLLQAEQVHCLRRSQRRRGAVGGAFMEVTQSF